MSTLENLRIFSCAADGKETPLRPSSRAHDNKIRYGIVAAAIDLGLRFHESPQGRAYLPQLANHILLQSGALRKPPPVISSTGQGDNMQARIDYFLRKLRQSFPHVYIHPNTEGEAEIQRYNWSRDSNEYDPVSAGRLFVSQTIVDNMVHALGQTPPDRRTYDTFKFLMGVSIAHEIVHLLTGFILAFHEDGREKITPPRVTVPMFGTSREGEAGRYWEKEFLGGIIELYEVPNHPLGVRQAGQAYIFPDSRNSAVGTLVSETYMAEVVSGNLSFPIRPTSGNNPPIPRAVLRMTRREATHLRRELKRAEFPEPTAPDRDASWHIAYRKPGSSSRW